MDRKSFLSLLGLGFLASCFEEDEEIEKDMNVKKMYNWWAGSSFSPSSLNAYLWVDSVNGTFVSTIDNNGTRSPGNIIDSANDQTGKALTISAVLGSQPVYNGAGWFFDINTQIAQGATGDYNFLHNGSDFDLYVVYYQCASSSGNQRAIINTNGFSSTALGLLLYYDNTGGTNSLKLRIGNGSASVISRDASSAITQNAINKIRVNKTGNTVTMYVNGTQVATQTNTGWSASNHASVASIMSSTSSTARTYLLDAIIMNRVLTASEVTNLDARSFVVSSLTDTNVYLFAGDSNCAGRGVNASIASDLTGAISGAYSERFNSNTPNSTSWIGKLEITKTNTLISENITTQHGLEMRFGKSMGADKDLFIIKYGVGSTYLCFGWNINTASSQFTTFRDNVITQALVDLIHGKRRNPIFRGIIWMLGANDSFVGGQAVSWSRSGTTVTITQTSHAITSTGIRVPITVSSDTGAIPLGTYVATRVDANTFTIVGVNTGATSGTLSYDAGSQYKQNFYDFVNAIIDNIRTTQFNWGAGGSGYTVNKFRILVFETRSGGSGFNATSYSNVVAAQQAIGSSYLTDNPSYSSYVLGSTSQSTEAYSTIDTVHYTTSAYDSIGQLADDYFDGFINE